MGRSEEPGPSLAARRPRRRLAYARVVRFVTWLLTTAAGVAVATWLFNGIYFTGPTSGSEELKHKIVPLLLVSLILGIVSSEAFQMRRAS